MKCKLGMLLCLWAVASSAVTITWDPPSATQSVTSHVLYYGLGEAFDKSVVIPMPAVSYVPVAPLFVEGLEYCFAVAAVNSIGESPRTDKQCAIMVWNAPAKPTGLKIKIP